MCSRLVLAACLTVFLSQPLAAQLPKLKPPKLPVPGTNKDAQQQAPAKPKCDNSSVVISGDVVSRYVSALKARDAEVQAVAKENSPTGRYYAAIAKRLELARRRADFRAQVGSDYARQQELQKKGMSTGDAATLQEAAMIEQNLDENKVELPETSWDAQKAGNDRIDAAMQRAGNFDACDWTSVTDVMPTIAYQLATDPDVKAADIHVGRPTGVTPDEVQAVRAKRVELARLLGTQYRTDAQLAKEKENQRAASAPASAGPMGPYNECMQTEMKPINDYVEKHKAELDAAQEKNDMTKLMQFADTQQKIMAKASMKCAPLMKTQ